MKSKSRKENIVEAKYYAIYLLRKNKYVTLEYIGGLFNLNHSTVMHGIKKITDLIDTGQVDWEL